MATEMKKFLAVFSGSPTGPHADRWEALDPATREKKEQEGMQAWGEWIQKNQSVIVDMGSPVGETKLTSSTGISDIHNQICGYTIVQAESHEAAAKLFINHPHFAIFPGTGVEIMECLPIPGM